MATDKQIAANRANAQKSTGPRTPAGKAASARNATTSGLYAKSLVIHGEDPGVLDALRREYLDEFAPSGPAERDLLDTLVHTEWIRRRIRFAEAAAWNRYIGRALDYSEREEEPYDHTDTIGYAFESIPARLDHIRRKLAGLDRLYRTTLADLQKLQSARRAAETASRAPRPAPPRPPKNGFVPSRAPKTPPPNPSPARPAAPDKMKRSPQNKNHEIWRHRLSRKQLRPRRVLRGVHQPRAEGRVHLA